MKKKILIFSLAYYPKHIGGAEVAIKEITDRIDMDQYEFHLICNRYDNGLPEVEQIGNVLVHRIGLARKNPSMSDLRKFPLHLNKLLFQFFAYWKARQLHKRYNYDGIWTMMAHSCGVPAALFKRSFPDVPYVLSLQEGDPPERIERQMRVFGPLFKEAFTRADVLQTISSFLMKWGKHMGFTGKSVVIPNAVNVTQFSQSFSDAEVEAIRASLGKKEKDVFLVTTSRLVHKNAVDDVIRAIALLPTHVHFVVYGVGPEEEKLKNLAKELSVTDRVHFMGHIDHKDMPLALKACDIFIRPSRSEGMGNSFIEAMAAGLPVIATQEGGIADFLFDAKRNPEKESTGFAVDADSPEQIKDVVHAILDMPERTATVVQNASAMVGHSYDWDHIAQRMKNEVFDFIYYSR